MPQIFNSRQQRDRWIAYAFLLPNIIGFLLFMLGPIIASLVMSLFRWDIFTAPTFIDWDNFSEIFSRRSGFWLYLQNTIFFSLSVPLGLMLALFLALILNQPLRGMSIFKTIYFLPVVSSAIAVAIIWQWLLNKDFGIINALLIKCGFTAVDWLGSPLMAKISIVLMTVWKGLGYNILIYLAALQSIPDELYEAAHLDGAASWRRFLHITLPLLGPAHLFLFITGFIATFQLFGPIYVMTQGGPLKGTWSLVYEIWWKAFREFRMGYAAALSWILFAIIFVVTLVQWRYAERKIHYS
ncbi:MAG: sugar ABC transporter permease [candidate division KSB1 bacterium]|nr:sugar ABC transporter permease [candidate division KSB1 bacterium]MDZ7366196.1 sugar ABC transporter permease [candidate division KSB1 bacterium]MDZ7404414.1 sugar ABC transporter permease [candidate division KSB1 bacterium]